MKGITVAILLGSAVWLAPPGALAQEVVQQQEQPPPSDVPPPPQTNTAPPQQQVIVVEQGSAQQQQYAPAPVDAQPVTQTRARIGLVIGGAVLFGVSYVIHAALVSPLAGINFDSSDDGQWSDFRAFGAVPLVGPFIQLAVKPTPAFEDSWATYLVVDALLQTAGLTMLILGFVLRKEVTSYADNGTSIQFGPLIGQGAAGLSAFGRF